MSRKNKQFELPSEKVDSFCPICDRLLIEGISVDRHHFTPKMKGGKETTVLHVICHRKLHSVFTESEMAKYYNTPEKCKEHEMIKAFVKWIKKKPNDYIKSNKESKQKKRSR